MIYVAEMKKQLSLGELIFLLSRINPEATCRYDFGGLVPKGIDSYRGYYDQLALGFEPYPHTMTVSELMKLCQSAVGKTFDGWKGGIYPPMSEHTQMWVANRGNCHGTAIVGVIDLENEAIIETAYCE